MAHPTFYLVAALYCICVLPTTNVVLSFTLPGFALRHRSLNHSPNVIGQFLERKNVASECRGDVERDLGDDISDEASATTSSRSTQRRTSSTRVVPSPRQTTSVRRPVATTSFQLLSSTSVFL